MQREYLFKGKRIDDEKWIEGYGMSYYKGLDTAVIIHKQGINTMHHTEVIPDSVCEFAGISDDNGVKIFENDPIHCWGGTEWNGMFEYDYHGICKFLNGSFVIVTESNVCIDFGNIEHVVNEAT